jgi:hypothetical protein
MDATIEKTKYKNAQLHKLIKSKKYGDYIESVKPLWHTLEYVENGQLLNKPHRVWDITGVDPDNYTGWLLKFWTADITEGYEIDVAAWYGVCEEKERKSNTFIIAGSGNKYNLKGFRKAFDKHKEYYKRGEL